MVAVPHEQFGPYLVYEQLGIGGMASVHRAELAGVEGFRRVVALKRMLPHVAANDDMVRAFVREARLASHLRHENVAQTYELGRVDTIYFIAMELITGRNLREILKHCAITNTGPMPVPVALHILNQICDALDYAHNLADETGQPLGIIHRDVTPSNIIVSEGGVVKLIDFGIAKASAAGMQTMSGTLKGKFGYMAPEYIAGSIDARADLFAVGVIAHELLTNRPLFTGRDDLETLQRVQQMDIQPPSVRNKNVPREVDDIVMTALARNPDQRWQHATALRTVLGTITKRMGLVATNTQVYQWIESAFEATNPKLALERNDEEPSMQISMQEGTSQLSPDQRFQMLTPLTAGLAMPRMEPDTPIPAHTPSRITAQKSIPPTNDPHADSAQTLPSMPPARAPLSQQMTAQAVPALRRHQGIGPEHGLMVDDVVPTQPRIVNTPSGAIGGAIGVRSSNPEIAIPRTVTPPQPATPVAPQMPGVASQRSSNPGIAIPRTVTPPSNSPTPAQFSPPMSTPQGPQRTSGLVPQQQTVMMTPSTPSTPQMPRTQTPQTPQTPQPQPGTPMQRTTAQQATLIGSMPTPQPQQRTTGQQQPVVMSAPNHPTIFAGTGPVNAMPMNAMSPASPAQSSAITAERVVQAAPTPAPAEAVAPKTAAPKRGLLLPIILILIVAGAAGAVVYFVLPQLT